MIQDSVTVTGLHHLTQLTGCTHPSAGACTFPVGLVTGCSVLTQAALQTVSSIKPRRAFWEKTYRKKHVFHPSITCLCAVFLYFHPPSVQLGPVQPGVHAHCPLAGWQMPLLRQLQVWLHPSP